MSKTPLTDLKILKFIYDTYLEDFLKYSTDELDRDSIIYVPIDIAFVAEKLGADAQLVFGRLYYDLDKRHRYEQDDGSKVHLFALKVGGDRYAVNFPLLEGTVANLTDRNFRFWLPLIISIGAFVVSLLGASASVG